MKRVLFFAIAVILIHTAAFSEDKQKDVPEFKVEFPKEVLSETKHTVQIAGKSIEYSATAGNLLLKEENGRPKANIFFIAYTRAGATADAKRPLTFSFNGGPGSSSVWLHLGLLGPKRVVLSDDGFATPPPYSLADNENSLLDETDLVFIDPVTTGYSRAVPGEDDRQFHGLEEDTQVVGDFIRLYLTRFKRWDSPKFLIGESYGTTRAASLSSWLQDRHGIYLNGIMLISSILNFETARFNSGNDLPYILFLPTYTATAWYHKKLPADLQADLPKALQQARDFASGEYTLALMKGARMSDAERASVVQKLSRFTGLTPEYIEETNLRVEIRRFAKQLLRDQRLTVGRLDSRFTGRDRDAAGEEFEFDPSNAAITGPFTATLNAYVREDLKYESDLPYEILTGRVRPWSYAAFQNQYVDVSENLRKAMNTNPAMKVFVACGYFDMATPFFAAEYTLNRLPLEPEIRKNVTMDYFDAGHMMYIHKPSLSRLRADLVQFIESAAR